PNFYQLSSRSIHVTYSTNGIDGKPHLSYQDARQTLSFAGEEIRVAESDLGTIVSVAIRRTVDSGSTTFSLILPRVVLADLPPCPIPTRGITVVHRFSVVPAFNRGQLDSYAVVKLHGTASIIRT